MKGCGICKFVGWLLGLVMLLLLLVNLGVDLGGLGPWIETWWPAAFVLMVLVKQCPCKKK